MTTGREMTTEEFREAERQAREYNERVRDICPTCNTLRTRLAEAKELLERVHKHMSVWGNSPLIQEIGAFLEGSQEVSE